MSRIILLTACLFLLACGEPASDTPPEAKATVFDPLVKDLDKAKAVEDLALQQKEKIDAAMQSAEGEEVPE